MVIIGFLVMSGALTVAGCNARIALTYDVYRQALPGTLIRPHRKTRIVNAAA